MIEPIKVPLSAGAESDLKRHLKDRITALKQGLKPLHETNLPRWRRIYEAMPAEKTRDFPFQNASNLVVPLAGIHSDTLHARVMGAVWKTRPVWVARLLGTHDPSLEPLREAWEDYLQEVGIEPNELDCYRVESEWFAECIRYGMSTLKAPYEKVYEDFIIPAGDGTGKYTEISELKYKGPRPEKLAFEDFLAPPSAKTLEQADIKVHRVRLQKWQLMERRYKQFYPADKVDKILDHPDRQSPDFVQSQREQDASARTSSGYGFAEWDVYECWLSWRQSGSKYAPKIICWYHLKTDVLLMAIFNHYTQPLGCDPFAMIRLLYRDDSLHGYGMCELLEMIQEEVSVIHNQRRDNMTVANTRVWRVNPDSKLHQGYQIFPSAMLPAEAGEIEPLQHGELSGITIEEERLSLELAERRSGVSPPMQGFGAGTQTKRGIYSAMGTLSLLQEGNRRTDLIISDIRFGHTKLGRILSKEYAHFGLDESKLLQFGDQAELVSKAAEMIRKGRLGLPIYSATASVNKEVEKQNDLMLAQVMARHYGMIAQLLQQASVSVLPQPVRDYMVEVVKSSDFLMKEILRAFDKDDVGALVPDPFKKKGGAAGGQSGLTVLQSPQSPAMAGGPGGQTVPGLPGGVVGGQQQ